jgi:hypothetical protein
MRRRDFLKVIACSTAPWPLTARAQPSRTRPLIAWMSGQTRTLSSPFFGSFLKGMRDLGHVEGQNFDMLYRFSDGYGDRLPIIGEELAQIKPTIVVATAVDCAVAMRRPRPRNGGRSCARPTSQAGSFVTGRRMCACGTEPT